MLSLWIRGSAKAGTTHHNTSCDNISLSIDSVYLLYIGSDCCVAPRNDRWVHRWCHRIRKPRCVESLQLYPYPPYPQNFRSEKKIGGRKKNSNKNFESEENFKSEKNVVLKEFGSKLNFGFEKKFCLWKKFWVWILMTWVIRTLNPLNLAKSLWVVYVSNFSLLAQPILIGFGKGFLFFLFFLFFFLWQG